MGRGCLSPAIAHKTGAGAVHIVVSHSDAISKQEVKLIKNNCNMLPQFMFVSLSSLNLWNLFQKILICMDTKKKKNKTQNALNLIILWIFV